MKLSRSQLKKLILEELALVAVQPPGGPVSPGAPPAGAASGASLSEALTMWLGHIRAVQLWFHSAHHVVSGPSYAGDHVNLYGRIYDEVQVGIDGDVEKAVGVTADIGVACAHALTEIALGVLQKYPSPVSLDAEGIADTALKMVRDHIGLVEQLFDDLEASGELTLGLNDHLAAQANTFETYVYLLQQRAGSPGM